MLNTCAIVKRTNEYVVAYLVFEFLLTSKQNKKVCKMCLLQLTTSEPFVKSSSNLRVK